MAKRKRHLKGILIFLAVLITVFLIFLAVLFAINWSEYAHINKPTDWHVFVKSNVINTLNNEYNQNVEKVYCVDGIVDSNNKEVIINAITSVEVVYSQKNQATFEPNVCQGKLGMIHTHPKYLEIVPECFFTEIDIFTMGIAYGEDKTFLGGVYCDKDKISFYLAGSEKAGNLFLTNSRIGYTLIL